jgi:hypothetical protein
MQPLFHQVAESLFQLELELSVGSNVPVPVPGVAHDRALRDAALGEKRRAIQMGRIKRVFPGDVPFLSTVCAIAMLWEHHVVR